MSDEARLRKVQLDGMSESIRRLQSENAALKAELATFKDKGPYCFRCEENVTELAVARELSDMRYQSEQRYRTSAEKLALAIREYLVGIGCVNNHVMLDRLYKAEAAYAKTSASDAGTTEEK